MKAVFCDTWAYVALANRRDPAHEDSKRTNKRLRKQRYSFVTTDYVLDESVTLLKRAAGHEVAVQFGENLHLLTKVGKVKLELVDPIRQEKAWELFKRYHDHPKISFTDCTSFVVMEELGIKEVFTGDEHFEEVNLGFLKIP